MLQDYIRSYYENAPLTIPECWNLSRKHIRAVLDNGSYIKLNRYRNRLNVRSVKGLCWKYAPIHVYFSVLNWLFPERVGRKCKANRALPIGGEYVFDVDSSNVWVKHAHFKDRKVCPECLHISKDLTLHILEAVEENYSNIQVVFSGRRGFHIHVMDFDYKDWTFSDPANLIKSHEVARYKYTLHLASTRYGFNRSHFVLATDPMRVISLPFSLNASGELVCIPIGDRKDLERLTIEKLMEKASPYRYIRFNAHHEPCESASKPIMAYAG